MGEIVARFIYALSLGKVERASYPRFFPRDPSEFEDMNHASWYVFSEMMRGTLDNRDENTIMLANIKCNYFIEKNSGYIRINNCFLKEPKFIFGCIVHWTSDYTRNLHNDPVKNLHIRIYKHI